MFEAKVKIEIHGDVNNTFYIGTEELIKLISLVNVVSNKGSANNVDLHALNQIHNDENISTLRCPEHLKADKDLLIDNSDRTNIIKPKRSQYTKKPVDIEVLKRLYIDEDMTAAECCSQLGISDTSFWRHASTHGISKKKLKHQECSKSESLEVPPVLERHDNEIENHTLDLEQGETIKNNVDGDYDHVFGLSVSKVREVYNKQDNTISQTAHKFGVEPECMRRFIQKHGLRKIK